MLSVTTILCLFPAVMGRLTAPCIMDLCLLVYSTNALPVSSVCAGDWSVPVSVGCVAGDAQSYILFCDFFDRIIEAYHGHRVTSHTPESDFKCDNLKVAQFIVINLLILIRNRTNTHSGQSESGGGAQHQNTWCTPPAPSSVGSLTLLGYDIIPAEPGDLTKSCR